MKLSRRNRFDEGVHDVVATAPKEIGPCERRDRLPSIGVSEGEKEFTLARS